MGDPLLLLATLNRLTLPVLHPTAMIKWGCFQRSDRSSNWASLFSCCCCCCCCCCCGPPVNEVERLVLVVVEVAVVVPSILLVDDVDVNVDGSNKTWATLEQVYGGVDTEEVLVVMGVLVLVLILVLILVLVLGLGTVLGSVVRGRPDMRVYFNRGIMVVVSSKSSSSSSSSSWSFPNLPPPVLTDAVSLSTNETTTGFVSSGAAEGDCNSSSSGSIDVIGLTDLT
jgi:hypothetical protein